MKFELLLTNCRRLRRVLWGMAAGYGLCLAVVALAPPAAFWWLVALPLVVLGLLPFWDQLFRQPAWVRVAADGVAWANPADGPPVRYPFAELRAYRFESSKLDNKLLLYLHDGERASMSGRLHQDFLAMQKAFEQAIKQYNQANPAARVVPEPEALEQFFAAPVATQVLWGLLVAGAVGVGWGSSHGAPGAAYLPVLLVLLPYLVVWANFYHQRP